MRRDPRSQPAGRLTGAGGAGKTRLAVRIVVRWLPISVTKWDVELAPIADPDLVPVAMVGALGLADQPSRPATGCSSGRIMSVGCWCCWTTVNPSRMSSAALITALLSACPRLTLLATSREPIGVAGEVTGKCRRSRSTRRGHRAVRRPSAPVESDHSHRRQRRCEGDLPSPRRHSAGHRTRRGPGLCVTLPRSSIAARPVPLVDRWCPNFGTSPADAACVGGLVACTLSEPERGLFYARLAAFHGWVRPRRRPVPSPAAPRSERYQVLDQLTLLVDKSWWWRTTAGDGIRYRLLETVRQYALEKLGESGEADTVRAVTAITTP